MAIGGTFRYTVYTVYAFFKAGNKNRYSHDSVSTTHDYSLVAFGVNFGLMRPETVIDGRMDTAGKRSRNSGLAEGGNRVQNRAVGLGV